MRARPDASFDHGSTSVREDHRIRACRHDQRSRRAFARSDGARNRRRRAFPPDVRNRIKARNGAGRDDRIASNVGRSARRRRPEGLSVRPKAMSSGPPPLASDRDDRRNLPPASRHPSVQRFQEERVCAPPRRGAPFEPHEENPMLGWRGASRAERPSRAGRVPRRARDRLAQPRRGCSPSNDDVRARHRAQSGSVRARRPRDVVSAS